MSKLSDLFKKRKPVVNEEKTKCRCLTSVNGIVVELELLETRQFYDTRWLVTVTQDGKSVQKQIIRFDDETFQNLDECVRELSEFTEETLASLDQKHKVYYD